MTPPLNGVIRGKTIQLDQDPGLQEGQRVEVVVRPALDQRVWGEGIRRSAGVLAMDPEDDRLLEGIRQDRRRTRVREVGE